MKKQIAVIASAAALGACLMGLAGCSSNPDVTDIQGVWEVDKSEPTVTVVFTDTEWKLATGLTYTYSMDTDSHVISYEVDGMSGSSTYEFSSDRQTLTLVEDTGDGETRTTVFDKVSDDTTAEPTVGED